MRSGAPHEVQVNGDTLEPALSRRGKRALLAPAFASELGGFERVTDALVRG